jgi:hypothetical protein
MPSKPDRKSPSKRMIQAPPTESERRSFPRWLWLLPALVVVGLAIPIAMTLGGGGTADPTARLAAAGCSFQTYPSQGGEHVQSLTAKVNYNSFPPTSGPHYFKPALWGFYNHPLVQVQVVHNLEHGGIVIQWGSAVPPTTVDRLRAFWRESPDGMLLAPLPQLSDKIALTAWTHLAICGRFAQDAFVAFRDAYRAKGPERFPLSALKPGT